MRLSLLLVSLTGKPVDGGICDTNANILL